jgi:hypothetical protein
MGLGKILGSISPAFGLVSGKGLFGDVGHALGSNGGIGGLASFGGLGLLLNLLGGHSGGDEPAPPPAPAQPLARMGGPGVGQVAGSLPQLPNGPNLGQQLGGALANSSGGGDYSAGLSGLQAPQAIPANHGGLQAMLQALGLL